MKSNLHNWLGYSWIPWGRKLFNRTSFGKTNVLIFFVEKTPLTLLVPYLFQINHNHLPHVTFLLRFLIFAQFTIQQSKRSNLADTLVFPKFKRFDWRVVNCAKIKNGSKNVTPCNFASFFRSLWYLDFFN